MYQAITKNKFKSGLIISIFISLITLIVYYLCVKLELGNSSIIIALAFSIFSALSSYYFSDQIVLRMNGARQPTAEESRVLTDILDNLVASASLKYKPRLYVIDSLQPNAFATGRNPQNSVICVTTGLLSKLDFYELEGVIAHELSHIKNYDIMLSAVVTVMVGFLVMLCDWLVRIAFFRGSDRNSKDGRNSLITILGLVCLVLGPLFAQLMQLAFSRRREYLADATSVQFTSNPDGLISALQKLDSDNSEFDHANNSTAHMFIVAPFKKSATNKKMSINMFSTHPPISSRIEELQKLR